MCAVEEQQEWRSAPGPSSSSSVLVGDLLPSTEYQFSVMPHNKLGSGPFSDITSARTMGQNQLLLPLLTSSRSSFSLSRSICTTCDSFIFFLASYPDALPASSKLEPPTPLSFNQSSEGVYLRWAVPSTRQLPIDSFVLQSRLEDGEWSTLDEDISANKSEMLVQGLQKVLFGTFVCLVVLRYPVRGNANAKISKSVAQRFRHSVTCRGFEGILKVK